MQISTTWEICEFYEGFCEGVLFLQCMASPVHGF